MTTSQQIATLTPVQQVAAYELDFGKVLPETFKAATFVRLAQGVLRRDGDLHKVAVANPNSLMVALLDCSRLGHEPGTDEYYLTPRGIKNGMVTNKAEVVGIEGYKGIVKRMLNHSRVLNVVAEAVYTNDPFRFIPGEDERPWHHPDWFEREGSRGELIGSYAYALLTRGGTSRVVVLGPRQLAAAERAAADFSFLWKGDNRETAYRKTALRRLTPYVPK
jgi:recombination protein RecT